MLKCCPSEILPIKICLPRASKVLGRVIDELGWHNKAGWEVQIFYNFAILNYGWPLISVTELTMVFQEDCIKME